MRLLLDNPDFEDQVILDLSRWEDWSVLDRLVGMFKKSEPKAYVRQPVVTYLTVAGDQPGDVGARAKAALADLEAFDPDTVKQARSLMAFGALARARADTQPAADEGKGNDASAADTGAFAASAEDEATDPADIPDPTAYEKTEGTAATIDTDDTATEPIETTAAKVVDEKVASANSSQSGADANSAKSPQPALLIGVPLIGATMLMGVYWLILRIGAL
jgi:hypothetical protein